MGINIFFRGGKGADVGCCTYLVGLFSSDSNIIFSLNFIWFLSTILFPLDQAL